MCSNLSSITKPLFDGVFKFFAVGFKGLLEQAFDLIGNVLSGFQFGKDFREAFFDERIQTGLVFGNRIGRECVQISTGCRVEDGDLFFVGQGRVLGLPEGRLQTPLKTGLAELVKVASPIVLAFHHHGMREVLPIGSRVPRVGKTVTVRFGEPADSRSGLAERSIAEITEWATAELVALERRSL